MAPPHSVSPRKWLLLAAALWAAAPTLAANAVPYPQGYRQWTHVKSMTINEGHALYSAFGGIHHLYANPKAEQGYKTGTFSNGAVIVFDLLEAKEVDKSLQEGARKVLGVMHKDNRKYRDTGGFWGFEAFKGDSKTERAVGNNAAAACYQCHTAKKGQGFVFSTFRK